MNRRILLIDADPGFRTIVQQHVGRYRFNIIAEPNADKALALATAELPALIIISVDEPDKAGFKIFQKCKKGALVKVPIMLVTSTVPPSSFTKHRELKAHADEYLDRRGLAVDELLGKIDNLIGLGEVVNDDLDIPVEVDEIALSDGDMVLEETDDDDGDPPPVAAPAPPPKAPAPPPKAQPAKFSQDVATVASFGPDSRTVNARGGAFIEAVTEPASPRVDKVVDAEMDDAFAALLGDDMFGGAPSEPPAPVSAVAKGTPVPEPIETREDSGGFDSFEEESHRPHSAALEALQASHDRDRSTPASAVEDDDIPIHVSSSHIEVIPEPIPEPVVEHESIPEPVVEHESIPEPVVEHEPIPEPVVEPEPVAHHEPEIETDRGEPTRMESLSRYESSPAIMLDAADLVEEIAIPDEESAVPEAVPHPLEAAPPPAEPEPVVPPPRRTSSDTQGPVPVHVPNPTGRIDRDTEAPPMSAKPRFVEIVTSATAIDAPRGGRTSTAPPMIDLGLDAVAEDAQSEQSGVYDRRSLRKIGELERQVAQLKTELDRARQAADAGSKGPNREREFLNLRETIIVRDKELQKAKDDLAARERELVDAVAGQRTSQQGRTALEAKSFELEKRLQIESGRAQTLETREKTLVAQTLALQAELEAKSAAQTNAESARIQIERDLAAERARHAAGASDAERSLRVEREQLIARHQGELGSVRGEAEKLREAAAATLRAELEAAHATATSDAIEATKRELVANHDQVKNQLLADHGGELERVKSDHSRDLAALHDQHASALSGARADAGLELQKVRESLETALTTSMGELSGVREAHAAELAQHKATHADELQDAHAAHAAALSQVRNSSQGELDRIAGELARTRTEHERALREAQAGFGDVLEQTKAGGLAELVRTREAHASATATLETERDRAIAELVGELDHVKGAFTEMQATHEHALVDARGGHEDAVGALVAEHAGKLEELARQHAQAIAQRDREHAGTHEARAAEHAQAIARLTSERDQQIVASELKHAAVTKEMEDLVARHETHKGAMIDEQRHALEAVRADHAKALAGVEQEKARALEEIQRAGADHRTATDRAKQAHEEALVEQQAIREREAAEHRAALAAAKRAAEDAAAQHQAERATAEQGHAATAAELRAQHERAIAVANGEIVKHKAIAEAEHGRAIAALKDEHAKVLQTTTSEHAKLLQTTTSEHDRVHKEVSAERDEVRHGLSSARETTKRLDGELASAVQTIADRNAELRAHVAAIAERDTRIADLRKEIEGLEAENASYQEQVLRAYQKIKTDEATVMRARKAMAIALTVLDDQGTTKPDA